MSKKLLLIFISAIMAILFVPAIAFASDNDDMEVQSTGEYKLCVKEKNGTYTNSSKYEGDWASVKELYICVEDGGQNRTFNGYTTISWETAAGNTGSIAADIWGNKAKMIVLFAKPGDATLKVSMRVNGQLKTITQDFKIRDYVISKDSVKAIKATNLELKTGAAPSVVDTDLTEILPVEEYYQAFKYKATTTYKYAFIGQSRGMDVLLFLLDENGNILEKEENRLEYSLTEGKTYFIVAGPADLSNIEGQFSVAARTHDGSKLIGDAEISIPKPVYDGQEHEPEVDVEYGGTELSKGTDFKVTLPQSMDKTNAGKTAITIEGQGDYSGTISKTFEILKADQNGIIKDSYIKVIKGKTSTISLNQTFGTKSFISGNKSVATVTSAGVVKGVKVGTTKITVKAGGDRNHNEGAETIKVIVPSKISSAVLSSTSLQWNGSNRIPDIKSINGSTKLKEGVDYEADRPQTCAEIGTYSIVISAVEDSAYYGSVTKTYKVVRANQAISIDIPTLYVGEKAAVSVDRSGEGAISYSVPSSSRKYATVDESGIMTGKSAGKVTLTVKVNADSHYNAGTKKKTVTVNKKSQIVDASVDNTTIKLKGTEAIRLGEVIAPNGKPGDLGYVAQNNGKITYSTSSKTYATVNSSGVITAKKAGTVKITVKAAGSASVAPASKVFTIKIVK